MDILDAHLLSNLAKLISSSIIDVTLSFVGFSISEVLMFKPLIIIAPGILISKFSSLILFY